jgi:hypothetical protein
MLSVEPIGWFGEVPSELCDDTQVNPDSGGRVMTDLEIFQHPLSKWGYKKNSFRCDHTTNGARPAGGLVQYQITAFVSAASSALNLCASRICPASR